MACGKYKVVAKKTMVVKLSSALWTCIKECGGLG